MTGMATGSHAYAIAPFPQRQKPQEWACRGLCCFRRPRQLADIHPSKQQCAPTARQSLTAADTQIQFTGFPLQPAPKLNFNIKCLTNWRGRVQPAYAGKALQPPSHHGTPHIRHSSTLRLGWQDKSSAARFPARNTSTSLEWAGGLWRPFRTIFIHVLPKQLQLPGPCKPK